MTSDPDRLIRELVEQAERRRRARSSAREALVEIARLLPEAIAAGISKREIARQTGLSRGTIDELLARRDN